MVRTRSWCVRGAVASFVAALALVSLASPGYCANAVSAWEPLDTTLFVPCYGEDVVITGWLHVVVAGGIDRNGGLHVAWHYMAQGVGVGQESGYRYVFDVSAPWSKQYSSNGDTIVNQEVLKVNLIGQGGAPNLRVRLLIKTTLNANGELTVDILRNEVICG